MNFDVTDAPPQAMSGVLRPGEGIARHQIRASEAIVLIDPVKQGIIDIAAGSVLAKVTAKSGEVVWCSTKPIPLFHPMEIDCLQDSQHSGKLDRFWSGELPGQAAPFIVASIYGGPAITPAGYRTARPEERPTSEIGYLVCRQPGDADVPPQFTPIIKYALGWVVQRGSCPFGQWPDPANRSIVAVDRITIKIGGTTAQPTFEVLNRIPPEPLAPFAPGQSFRGADSPSLAEQQRAEIQNVRVVVPTGAASDLATGLVAHGDTLMTVPVAHGVTGVLKNDVIGGDLLSGGKLIAGQYMFGIPMSGATGAAITWCAPRPVIGKADTFSTVCFPAVGSGRLWLDAGSSLLVTAAKWRSPAIPNVNGFSVERKPASLGLPMKLAYVFDKWSTWAPDGRPIPTVWVGVEMRVNGVMSPISHVIVYGGSDGVFRIPLLGGEATFAPVSKSGAVMTPPAPGSNDADLKAFLSSIDPNRAAVKWVHPPKADGALPVTGFIHSTGRSVPTPSASAADKSPPDAVNH